MEKRQIKKWNEKTQKERKRAKINLCLFSFIVLILLFIVISTCGGPSQEENYISGPDPNDITSQLESENYSTQILSSFNNIYWSSFQPKFSYGITFSDRIQIYSDNNDKISAIRIESMTGGKDISDNKEAKQHFYWIGSLLQYPTDVVTWIKINFNKHKASLMLDKYTKIVIYAPDNNTRRMDIFKMNDTNKKSPIPDDQLFGY